MTRQTRGTPHPPNRTGLPAGSAWPAASACRWAFSRRALYLFELWRRAPLAGRRGLEPGAGAAGLWLRGYAAGYVKKNRELTVTGPYAHTRNPLYLGSMLMAAGFAWRCSVGRWRWCWRRALPRFTSR
jgi:hypothetical protein